MAQDTPAEDSGEIRKKAMARLIVAGVVTATALGALWWLDRDAKPEKKKASKAPTPIVAAPKPILEPSAPAPEAPPAEAKLEPPPPPEAPEAHSTGKSGAPPLGGKKPASQAGALTPTQTTPAGPMKIAPNSARPVAPPVAGSEIAKPSIPTSAAPPRTETPTAYVVQLGVFADPANAKDLVERLSKLGVQARMETRVQVGPFDKRDEAEKARAAMLKLGVKGVVATK